MASNKKKKTQKEKDSVISKFFSLGSNPNSKKVLKAMKDRIKKKKSRKVSRKMGL